MKNTFKRIFALLLALVMVLSLAACGGEKAPAAEAGQPAADGAGKITILYPGEETPRFKEFLENEFAEKIKADLNLEIEMIWLPWDQYWDQKEIMLSAQNPIDLYWDGLADLSTFVNKHQARPLDDLIQTYGQDMLKVIPMSWLEGGKMNGEIFGIPSAYGPSSAQFQLVCVRQDLLEGVGMTEIKTAEDLVAFATKVKEQYPEGIYVFIAPPSFEELRNRLTGRNTETQEQIDKRLAKASSELDRMNTYDYIVVNSTVEEAVKDIENILSTARLRPSQQTELIEKLLNK